jgi:D-proline reductase (dithiol) PrdB
MKVDSFKYIPRILGMFYQNADRKPIQPIPWTPLELPLTKCKFGLISSGGLYYKTVEPPFDMKREIKDPTWGDPTFRTIPAGISQKELGVSNLHINTDDLLADMNILLPLQRFTEFVDEGRIGALASFACSFMGYQGYPPDTAEWQNTYGPRVAQKFKAEGVNCILLTVTCPDCSINMPVLARTLETEGFSTILVSQVPFLVETVGTPRTLAVEFPFGHILGQPHNIPQQKRVLIQALDVLKSAKEPGTVIHFREIWPVPQKEAIKDWQPQEPSPLIKMMSSHFLEMAREQRKTRRGTPQDKNKGN